MKILVLSLVVVPVLICPATAKQRCPGDYPVVDKCFVVHGRLQISASLRPRIWHIGTKRVLQVEWKDGDENSGLTPEIGKIFDRDLEAVVFGDYGLCPISRNVPGHMQFVCMTSATNLVVVSSKQSVSSKSKHPG